MMPLEILNRPKAKPVCRTYKLLHGLHSQDLVINGKKVLEDHLEFHPDYPEDESKAKRVKKPKEMIYIAGDVFESYDNLLGLNGEGVEPKFALVDNLTHTGDNLFVKRPGETDEQFKVRMDHIQREAKEALAGKAHSVAATSGAGASTATANADSGTLSTMSLEELQKLAKSENIDIRGAKKREDIIALITAAMQE